MDTTNTCILNFKVFVYFQIDMWVTFHVRPINEYDPELTGNLDITITEVSSSCSSFFVPAIFSNTLLYGTP